MRSPKEIELLASEEQFGVPRHVPAQGVHEIRGHRIFLEAIPEPAQRIAGQLERGRRREGEVRVISGDRHPGAGGVRLTNLDIGCLGIMERGQEIVRRRVFERLPMNEVARFWLRPQVQPQ